MEVAGIQTLLSPPPGFLPLPPSRSSAYFTGSICAPFQTHPSHPRQQLFHPEFTTSKGERSRCCWCAEAAKNWTIFLLLLLVLLLLPQQLSNCKILTCWQQEHGCLQEDPPPQPQYQPLQSMPGLRTCEKPGVSVKSILLVSSFRDDMACTMGLIIPSSPLLKLCPRGQSFIPFVLIWHGTYLWKSISFALHWPTLQGYNYSSIL